MVLPHEENAHMGGPMLVLDHSKQERYRKPQQVRFEERSDGDIVIGRSSGSGVPPATTWYSLAELLSFKREFKRMSAQSLATMRPYRRKVVNRAFISIRLGRESKGCPLYISPHASHSNQNDMATTSRGLEYSCCYERQRRAILGRHAILRHAMKTVDADALARVARQRTAWAAQLAVEQAFEDSVYRYQRHQQQHTAVLLLSAEEDQCPLLAVS